MVSGGIITVVKISFPSDTLRESDRMGGLNVKATAESLLLWEQRIIERVQNGMTIGEWCKKNGMSKHQYYYWNRRVCEKRKTAVETVFADIAPILSTAETAR